MYIPIALTIAGLLTAFAAYRGIRRGGARFYTLEREAILRRASLSLLGSVLLFLAAIGLLAYQHQQIGAEEATNSGEIVEGELMAETPTSEFQQFPPLDTPTPTPDLNLPTATPTALICRAIVEGTFGNGLTLREAPNGAEVTVLAEATLLTMLEDEPVEADGLTWRKVRSVVSGDEGWVADQYLTLGESCQ
ncbi:MAG TPA: SH3 domain-containing protein [Anaerolineae bacterium]